MLLDEFQRRAVATAIYPERFSIIYPAMGAANEAGEVAGKVKKWMRGDGVTMEAIASEIGDTLWYLAALAQDIGIPLSHIAAVELTKIEDRAARGVIKGNGDNR